MPLQYFSKIAQMCISIVPVKILLPTKMFAAPSNMVKGQKEGSTMYLLLLEGTRMFQTASSIVLSLNVSNAPVY